MNLNPKTLQTKYTYISLELGSLVLCTQTQGSYMETYWPHHVTLAYLAATEPRWQGDIIENMSDTMTNLVQHSKGGSMIDEHHWMGRPRACHYYRHVKVLSDTGARSTWTMAAIVRFDGDNAQQLANSEARRVRLLRYGNTPTTLQ